MIKENLVFKEKCDLPVVSSPAKTACDKKNQLILEFEMFDVDSREFHFSNLVHIYSLKYNQQPFLYAIQQVVLLQ